MTASKGQRNQSGLGMAPLPHVAAPRLSQLSRPTGEVDIVEAREHLSWFPTLGLVFPHAQSRRSNVGSFVCPRQIPVNVS
ncbi:hypothetical protein [Auritidibacter sp. NML100628]|uniref:hypothetical protein n=1 Tax=Auritidibacter sp. NML100628 TaxID=2170742 RepID=UPI0011B23088|nr:hypothetical protein [Auritidibacter sp. NML100628]